MPTSAMVLRLLPANAGNPVSLSCNDAGSRTTMLGGSSFPRPRPASSLLSNRSRGATRHRRSRVPLRQCPFAESKERQMNVAVGQRATRSLTLTKAHVDAFAKMTGDYNPLHFDESFVAKTKFKTLVVQGGLTTGLLHALVAMDMPGPGTVFLSQNWKFTAPVYIDDTITAAAEILSVHASKPVTQLGIRVTRQTGEVVLEGEAWCYTFG